MNDFRGTWYEWDELAEVMDFADTYVAEVARIAATSRLAGGPLADEWDDERLRVGRAGVAARLLDELDAAS